MTITTLPTRDAADLGAALSNVRAPVANEFSAVNLEKIKDWIISLASEVGKTDGSTVGSLREAVDALGAAPGLLFELDTTVTSGLSATTEVQGKQSPGGPAFAGTITPAGDVSSPWDSATKMLALTTSGSMIGIGLRRLECGALPTAGFIVDVGIGDLDVLVSTHLVIAMYEQRAGTDARGIGIGIQHSTAALSVIGFGDDGTDSPAINTSPVTFMSADSWPAGPANFTRGPARAILEFRKVDASSPERWTLRVTLISIGGVTSQTYSGIAYPATGWSTSLDLAGATMDRIGIGAWCTSAEGGDMSISHLRVYELGSALPA